MKPALAVRDGSNTLDRARASSYAVHILGIGSVEQIRMSEVWYNSLILIRSNARGTVSVRLILIVLVMISSANCMAAAAEPTKIKGFYIGMTRFEAFALMPSDADFFEEKHSHFGSESVDVHFTVKYDGAPRNIAVFVLENDTVDSFDLRQEYFDRALTLRPDAFIKEVVAHYQIGNLQCAQPGQFDYHCNGRTPDGARVLLSWNTSPSPIASYANIVVSRPPEMPSGPKPSFD
ncbi:MAG: hypothetical protein JHD07_08845 [Bradyrhizobium sp.]|uniref:hypothetical protein n=1 Tax=Bradyrhizobium sp. TaxID=376 RepID=UPI001A310E14|nr:hypothetical protein [Bradyrhizobium sp.]MBJ7403385.1 hypothetical protein [Bradyrhizobium sp.]